MPRCLIIAASVLLFLVLILAALWNVFDWPPPRLILKYGLPPTGGPTGRAITIEGVEFVELKPGYFRMGSHYVYDQGNLLGRICSAVGLPWGIQPDVDGSSVPVHWVELPRAYWIARTEVTNEQWERFDPTHQRDRSFSELDLSSAAGISWFQASAYCDWLSKRGPLVVRLPSEAEWENACRCGTNTQWYFGDDPSLLQEHAWFDANWGSKSHPVATRQASPWGLFDMYGNVREWCEDTWHEDYRGARADGSAWVDHGSTFRVIRGGDTCSNPHYIRSGFRDCNNSASDSPVNGLRPAGIPR